MSAGPLILRASTAGRRAAAALAREEAGAIAGATSRGAFVCCAGDEVLFLTEDSHRGPLTINLRGAKDGLRSLRPGMAVRLGSARMEIAEAHVVFDAARAETWLPEAISRPALPPADRFAAAGELAALALRGAGEYGFAAWLCAACGESPPPPELLRLRRDLEASDAPAVIAFACDELLGRGRGLTPSGDDCVTGLLLALNRWHDVLWPGTLLEEVNAGIVEAARQCTTAISASLIECAAQGEADERLVDAIDGIVTGAPSLERCAEGLKSYGASSGSDALAGMVAAAWA